VAAQGRPRDVTALESTGVAPMKIPRPWRQWEGPSSTARKNVRPAQGMYILPSLFSFPPTSEAGYYAITHRAAGNSFHSWHFDYAAVAMALLSLLTDWMGALGPHDDTTSRLCVV